MRSRPGSDIAVAGENFREFGPRLLEISQSIRSLAGDAPRDPLFDPAKPRKLGRVPVDGFEPVEASRRSDRDDRHRHHQHRCRPGGEGPEGPKERPEHRSGFRPSTSPDCRLDGRLLDSRVPDFSGSTGGKPPSDVENHRCAPKKTAATGRPGGSVSGRPSTFLFRLLDGHRGRGSLTTTPGLRRARRFSPQI